MSVCLSVCNALSFESLSLERSFLLCRPVHIQNIQVKFVYQGHKVKVMVTGTVFAGHQPSIS